MTVFAGARKLDQLDCFFTTTLHQLAKEDWKKNHYSLECFFVACRRATCKKQIRGDSGKFLHRGDETHADWGQ